MNILVTGAAGLIGSELCRQLKYDNHTVFAVDNMSRATKIPECDEFYCRDLSKSLEFLSSIQDNIEIIYHLSAINGTLNFYKKQYIYISYSMIFNFLSNTNSSNNVPQ